MKALWNIRLINTGNGQEVYNENLSFVNCEPTHESIADFMSLIRPSLKYDYADYTFIGELNEIGRLIKN